MFSFSYKVIFDFSQKEKEKLSTLNWILWIHCYFNREISIYFRFLNFRFIFFFMTIHKLSLPAERKTVENRKSLNSIHSSKLCLYVGSCTVFSKNGIERNCSIHSTFKFSSVWTPFQIELFQASSSVEENVIN